MRHIAPIPKNIRILVCISLLQCILWSIYQLLLRPMLTVYSVEEIARSIIRVSIIGIPALIYIYHYKKEHISIYYNFNNIKEALLLGLFATAVTFLFFIPQINNFKFPLDIPAWLNWILGSPIIEELYFRGIILRELSKTYSIATSVIFSSLLFALFHLPQWIFTHRVEDYIVTISVIFMYGVLFSLLYVKTRSLIAPLLPHAVNNFLHMATSLVR